MAGNGIPGLRQLTPHKVAMPTAVLAVNVERVKRSCLVTTCRLPDLLQLAPLMSEIRHKKHEV
jgi:hypothetical protein